MRRPAQGAEETPEANDGISTTAPAEETVIEVQDDKAPPRVTSGCMPQTSTLEYKATEDSGNTQNRDKELDGWRHEYLNYSWPPLPTRSNTCSIFRVPSNLRDCDSKAYEPTVVAIGLLHAENSCQSQCLQKHKRNCVSFLAARHGSKERAAELLDRCIDLVLQLEPDARRCYAADDIPARYSDKKEFAKMLLQDGCFIVRLLLSQKNKSNGQEGDTELMSELKRWESEITEAPMVGRLWVWNMVVYDLLKLENQIPFFVLQRLFDVLKTPAEEDINLVELALELFRNVHPTRAKTFVMPPSSEILHLLHLYHSSLITPKLLENNTLGTKGEEYWIPSATKLLQAGIIIRPPNEGMEECFLEVTFKDGVIEIPPLQVDDCTKLVFRNLIAFEQGYPNKATHITNYSGFMDYLVNTATDVSLLSFKGVLLNRLGADEAVADLLNKLCDQSYYTPDRNYLSKVFTQVTESYEKPWNKWRAELASTYFNNPLSTLSIIATLFTIYLTILQTSFAVLSYYSPRN